jgi:signal peptidase I
MFYARTFIRLVISFSLLVPNTGAVLAGECLPAAHENCRNDFSMPAVSMLPTLLKGDNFFADIQVYNTRLPERGEVVIYISPKKTKDLFCKRIVGLPGDRIQMRDGQLTINGDAVVKHRLDDYVSTDQKGADGSKPVPQYEETLPNGITYRVLDSVHNGDADNTIEYIVPAEHYFVMGDNRDNSEDSRYLDSVGYIPLNHIIGKATITYFSRDLSRVGSKIN